MRYKRRLVKRSIRVLKVYECYIDSSENERKRRKLCNAACVFLLRAAESHAGSEEDDAAGKHVCRANRRLPDTYGERRDSEGLKDPNLSEWPG